MTRTRSRFPGYFKRDRKSKSDSGYWIGITVFYRYSMPVRVMDYDALEYKDQIRRIISERKAEMAHWMEKQR